MHRQCLSEPGRLHSTLRGCSTAVRCSVRWPGPRWPSGAGPSTSGTQTLIYSFVANYSRTNGGCRRGVVRASAGRAVSRPLLGAHRLGHLEERQRQEGDERQRPDPEHATPPDLVEQQDGEQGGQQASHRHAGVSDGSSQVLLTRGALPRLPARVGHEDGQTRSDPPEQSLRQRLGGRVRPAARRWIDR